MVNRRSFLAAIAALLPVYDRLMGTTRINPDQLAAAHRIVNTRLEEALGWYQASPPVSLTPEQLVAAYMPPPMSPRLPIRSSAISSPVTSEPIHASAMATLG